MIFLIFQKDPLEITFLIFKEMPGKHWNGSRALKKSD